MSDMSEFFRTTETELMTKNKEAEAKKAKDAADAQLLAALTASEWPLLIETLHTLTKDEGIGSTRFVWNDKTLSLGPALLTIFEENGMGLRGNTFKINRSMVGGANNIELLLSTLEDNHLNWFTRGIYLGSDRTTLPFAKSLVTDLVLRYKQHS